MEGVSKANFGGGKAKGVVVVSGWIAGRTVE